MSQQLVYGHNRQLQFDLPASCAVREFGASSSVLLNDPAAEVAAALLDPLEFPPLSAAAIPGDRVALTLERGTPQLAAVVAGVVHVLVESGVSPDDIALVMGGGREATVADPTAKVDARYRHELTVESHDCDVRDSLAYLAATRDGRPIYLNRRVCDADVVLPIGTVLHDLHPDYFGVFGSLFPGLTDTATQARYRARLDGRWQAEVDSRRAEAAEAAWLLGVQFTVQIVPAGCDAILNVVAGEANAVARRTQQLYESAWRQSIPGRADLVIATIEGGEEHQTWANVGRALFAASRVVSGDGAIVICSDIRQTPSRAIRQAAQPFVPDFEHLDFGDDDEAPPRGGSDDLLAASMISQLLETNRVYLLSGLDENDVEDIALVHVDEAEDVARLAARYDNCLLLANAPFVMPTLEQESPVT